MPRTIARATAPLVIAFLLLVSLLIQTGSAAQRSTAQPPEDGGGFRADLARTLVSSDDPVEDLATAARAAVAELTGSPASSGPAHYDAEVYMTNGGDLTGDGRDDGLEHGYLWGNDGAEIRVAGVDATDGSTLWQVTSNAGWLDALRAGDLDGDGKGDVILFEESYEYAYGETSQAEVFGVAASMNVRAIRGVDGSMIWTRPSSLIVADVSRNWESGAYGATQVSVPLAIGGDVDGDGAPDLLMGQYAALYQWNDVEGTYAGAEASAAFEILSGRTGTPRSVAPAGSSYADAALVPDLNGDGGEDVAILSFEPAAAIVTAYPGSGGPPVWTNTAGPFLWGYVTGTSLDGDGLGDVLLHEYVVEFDEEEQEHYLKSQELTALRGTDGSAMWGRELSPWVDVVPAGDATGDGGQELLVAGGGSDGFFGAPLDHDSYGDQLTLLRGSDGEQLWTRRFSRVRRLDLAGDVTGDGVSDALVSYAKRTRIRGKSRTVRTSMAVSGASGRVRWQRATPDGHLRPLHGDLNGDGAGDVIRVDGRNYRAVNGRTGASLWPRSVRAGSYLLHAAVLGTPAGGDIVESSYGSSWSSADTALRSGASGVVRWRRSVEFGYFDEY